MQQAKTFLLQVLVVAAGVAAYDLVIKPMINKSKTITPAATT